jgi:hypothetical protein
MAMVNAYVLFKKYGNPANRRTHQQFRASVVRSLIDNAVETPVPQKGSGRKGEPLQRLTERLFPAFNEGRIGAKRKRIYE